MGAFGVGEAEGAVFGDGGEPGGEGGGVFEGAEVFVGFEEGVLCGVGGEVIVFEDAEAEGADGAFVAGDEGAEGGGVSGEGGGDEGMVGGLGQGGLEVLGEGECHSRLETGGRGNATWKFWGNGN